MATTRSVITTVNPQRRGAGLLVAARLTVASVEMTYVISASPGSDADADDWTLHVVAINDIAVQESEHVLPGCVREQVLTLLDRHVAESVNRIETVSS